MLAKRLSSLSGELNEMDLPVSADELHAWQQSAVYVDGAFPHLSDAECEFLISGVTPAEWASIPEDWDGEEELPAVVEAAP